MFFENLSNVNIITDPGIYFEISDFFSSQNHINNVDIEINENVYIVSFSIANHNIPKLKSIFITFVSFIQYSHLTCYKRNIKNDEITYELITADEKLNGFYCKLNIKVEKL